MMQKFQDYQPSKGTLAWTAIGAAVLTMVAGFSVGGWVTGGSASSMAEQALEDGREQLVAAICVDKFISDTGAADNLSKLKEVSSYKQDNFIEDGGWSMVNGLDEQVSGAADLCAEQLAELEDIPKTPVAAATDTGNAGGTAIQDEGAEEMASEGENAG